MKADVLSRIIAEECPESAVVVGASGPSTAAIFVDHVTGKAGLSMEEWAFRVDSCNVGDRTVCVSYSSARWPNYDVFAPARSGGYFEVVDARVESGVLKLFVGT